MTGAEVIVVGGGLAGMAVAAFLAPEHDVLVVERAPGLGTEASSQNAGMIRRLGEDPQERALALRSAAWLSDPPPEFAEASRVTGALVGLAHDPTHLNDAVAHLRAAGVRVEAVDRPEEVAPAAAGTHLTRAWWLPDERVADPRALIEGFTTVLQRHGGRVRTGTAVRALTLRSGRVTGVETDEDVLGAECVVLATGAWSAVLAARAGLQRPLIPVRRTMLQTSRGAAWRSEHPWTWIDDVGVYARPDSSGWLVSGCDETIAFPREAAGSTGPLDPVQAAHALAKLRRYLPRLADVEIRGGWTGLRTFAPDRRPVLGRDPECVGLVWAAGLGGYGVTCCVGVGEAIASLLRDERVGWLRAAALDPGRPYPRRWPVRGDGTLHRARLRAVRLPDPA